MRTVIIRLRLLLTDFRLDLQVWKTILFFSPYSPATSPFLVTCFNFPISAMEKNFVTHGAIASRLHVAIEYLSNFNHVSTIETKKQLPLPNPVKALSTITTTILTNVLLLSPMRL